MGRYSAMLACLNLHYIEFVLGFEQGDDQFFPRYFVSTIEGCVTIAGMIQECTNRFYGAEYTYCNL